MVGESIPKEPVLLVDSDAVARAAFSALLTGAHYAVTTVRSGAEALQHLALGNMPCLIMFVLRETDDSVSFRAAQQANPTWVAVPTVLFSAPTKPGPQALISALLTIVGRHCEQMH
jgi:CheY-like chemotaxis protein